MSMRSLSKAEISAFLAEASPSESYKMKGHSWTPAKNTGKQYCKSCGLVAGNNKFTQWCIDKGCYHELHPQFKSTKRRLTKHPML